MTQVQGERLLGESRTLWQDHHSLAGGHQLMVEEISHLLVQQWLALLTKRNHSITHNQLTCNSGFAYVLPLKNPKVMVER